MRLVDEMPVLLALVVISQMSCGGRGLGGDSNNVVSDDGAVGSDGCTVGCAGEPVSLAYERWTPCFIAVDSTHVYFTTWYEVGGDVMKVPK